MSGHFLTISDREDTSGNIMVLAGEADVTSSERLAGELMDRIKAPGIARLVVDVARLTFADSAAISTLIFASRVLRARRGSLVLLNPDERLRQILELTGAVKFLEIVFRT